jgi:hypothetical protein
MMDIYDPERLLAEAVAWRSAAETATPDERAICLSRALEREIRVERSINTPVIRVDQPKAIAPVGGRRCLPSSMTSTGTSSKTGGRG